MHCGHASTKLIESQRRKNPERLKRNRTVLPKQKKPSSHRRSVQLASSAVASLSCPQTIVLNHRPFRVPSLAFPVETDSFSLFRTQSLKVFNSLAMKVSREFSDGPVND